MLAFHKYKPFSALVFKGVGNKMAKDDGIFWENYWIKEVWKGCFSVNQNHL